MENARKNRLTAIIDIVLVALFSAFLLAVPFHKVLTKLIALSILICFTARYFTVRKKEGLFPATPLTSAWLIFLSAAVLSTAFSAHFFRGVEIVIQRYLVYFLFFLLSFAVLSVRENLRRLTWVILFSGILVGIGGIIDIVALRPYRLFTAFGQYVFHAGVLPFCLPLSLALLLHEKKTPLRLAAGACFALLIPALVWNGSRLLWITFIASSLFICFLNVRTVRYSVLIIGLCSAIFFTMPGEKQQRVLSIFKPFSRDSVDDRIDLAQSSVDLFKRHPVTGSGPGSFEFEYKPPQGHATDVKYIHGHAHNQYLEVAAEMGFLGLAAFLSLYALFFFGFLRRWPYEKEEQALVFGYTGAVFALLVTSLGCSLALVGMQESMLSWFFLAGAVVLTGRSRG